MQPFSIKTDFNLVHKFACFHFGMFFTTTLTAVLQIPSVSQALSNMRANLMICFRESAIRERSHRRRPLMRKTPNEQVLELQSRCHD